MCHACHVARVHGVSRMTRTAYFTLALCAIRVRCVTRVRHVTRVRRVTRGVTPAGHHPCAASRACTGHVPSTRHLLYQPRVSRDVTRTRGVSHAARSHSRRGPWGALGGGHREPGLAEPQPGCPRGPLVRHRRSAAPAASALGDARGRRRGHPRHPLPSPPIPVPPAGSPRPRRCREARLGDTSRCQLAGARWPPAATLAPAPATAAAAR